MDIIEKRVPFYVNAVDLLKYAAEEDIECYFSASSAKDVFYLVRRHTGSLDKAKNAIVNISNFATFCDTTKQDVQNALLSAMYDFEDAVLISGAERDNMDFIITRNTNDFTNSQVKILTPAEFLAYCKKINS